MRLVLGLSLALFLAAPARPGAAQTQVELYTMGPGDALFSKFGHAALCVVSAQQPGGGLCYNYGTTDFSRPLGLSWDVVAGQAKFWVSVSDLLEMLWSFQSQDRTIYRQVLPLTDEQAASLAVRLAIDAAPENREYVYSHFLDNCSTRPRDLVDAATGGALSQSDLVETRTYRDFAREGFAGLHWALVPAGDFILGRWVDQDIGVYEAMFIPAVLRRAVEAELGARPDVVYAREGPLRSTGVREALVRFWLVAIGLVLLAWVSRWVAAAAVAVFALLGALLWVGAAVSPWPELKVNELVLVLVPVDLWLSWAPAARARRYVRMRLAMSGGVALLLASGILIQPLWPFWVLTSGVLASFGWRSRAAKGSG